MLVMRGVVWNVSYLIRINIAAVMLEDWCMTHWDTIVMRRLVSGIVSMWCVMSGIISMR